MTIKTYLKTILISALVVMSFGGFLLHLRIHPFNQNASNIVPFIAGILSIVVVPLLFSFKRLVEYGYVLNGMLVIVGTITMAHFSIAHWPIPASFGSYVLKTTLADILLLWGIFLIGKSLFDMEFYGAYLEREKRGKTYRYPNLGWWIIHLFAISAIYSLGHVLWR
jgi:hypothetical protein